MTFYEFFSRRGWCGRGWGRNGGRLLPICLAQKAHTYRRNWGEDALVCDIAGAGPLPHIIDRYGGLSLQDLSVAGGGAGLAGQRSGSFWSLIGLLAWPSRQGRAPRYDIVVENVAASLERVWRLVAGLGYNLGPVVNGCCGFLPQSRRVGSSLRSGKGSNAPRCRGRFAPQTMASPAIVTGYQTCRSGLQQPLGVVGDRRICARF